MDFGYALRLVRSGTRMARDAWPVGDFIWLVPSTRMRTEWCSEPVLYALAEREGGEVECEGFIRHYSNGRVVTGWVPTQEDMLAEDWRMTET